MARAFMALQVCIDILYFFCYNNAISVQLCLTKKDRLVVLRLKHERKWLYELQKQSSKEMQDCDPPENVKPDSVHMKQLSNETQD